MEICVIVKVRRQSNWGKINDSYCLCFSRTSSAIILFAFDVFDKHVFLLAGHIVEDGQCEDLWTGH